MKSDTNKNNSKGSIIIYLLFIIVLLAFVMVFYFEKSNLEKEIEKNQASINSMSEQITNISMQLKHKQMEIDLLYDNTDIESDLTLSMKDIKITPPASEITFTSDKSEYDNAELIEKNSKYLNKVQINNPSYVVNYISTDNDKTVYFIVMSKVKQLSDEICQNCKTEHEKINAIAEWVSYNICYNNDAASKSVNPDIISLEQVISTHTATCAGYSNLFSALCQAQGIYCLNLRGSSSGDLYKDPEWQTAQTNHEWNAVYCDNTWLFYDTTWCSLNTYQNGEYNYADKVADEYLNMDFYEMTKDRRIDRVDYRDFYTALFEFDT